MLAFRVSVLLLIVLSLSALAQTPPAPELEIVRFGWSSYKPGRLSTETGMANAGDRNSPPLSREEAKRETLRSHAETSKDTVAQIEDQKRQQEVRERARTHSSINPEPNSSYQYSLEVKNSSLKQIAELQWDYVFTDPRTQQETFRYHFASRTKIKPGKSSKLTIYSTATPYLIVNADKSRAQENERIIIRRIVYADSSVWESH